MSTDLRTRAWIECQAAELRANFRTVADAAGGVKVIAMVKADGYGLGMERVVAALRPLEPWAYGVASVGEGTRLRRAGVTAPVLVFSPLLPGGYADAVEARLTPCISDLEGLDRYREAARRQGAEADFHVEIDTGMGRSGFDWRDVSTWGPSLLDAAPARWSGCFTHFHSADSNDVSSAKTQWARLNDTLGGLGRPAGPFVLHAANSAAALRFREAFAADAVRPGIFLYGGRAGEGLPGPRPVASLRARVIHVREAPPGTTVGYGATYSSSRWERWATLAIGYGDGLPRALGNRGSALVRGHRVPIIGRVSMDLTVVNISDVPGVEVGDVATLIGRDGAASITLDEVADSVGTISYEILTGMTRRLARVWFDDGG